MEEAKIEKKFLGFIGATGRIVIEVFLAGAGLIFWISATVLNPINDVKYDIREIKKDIATLNSNVEKHLTQGTIIDGRQDGELTEHDKEIAIILEKIK
jgi:hypothetical protein